MPPSSQTEVDTIVARATASGRGGIAVVRTSGSGVHDIANAIIGRLPEARIATLAKFRDRAGEVIDEGLALFFPQPHSFTGEDMLEFHVHGGPVVCEMLIERILQSGARLANPGEFSRRAFLNDKLDLSQAEAIADLIDSGSRAAALAAQRSLQGRFSESVLALNEKVTALRMHVEAAIDFPEEEIDFLDDAALLARLDDVAADFDALERTIHQGCLLRDGVHVVLAGRPNAGKSSLLNALAGYAAAIVTEIPGTTRDLVREHIDLDGLPVHIVDTAGLHHATGLVEEEGIRRTRQQLEQADHALVIIDVSRAVDESVETLLEELPAHLGYTVVRNKIDLTGEASGPIPHEPNWLNVSAKTGAGMAELRQHIKERVGFAEVGEGTITARQRHLDSLRKARSHFEAGRQELQEQRAGELLAEELLQVQNALAEITGEFTSDDLLERIFASFCIGK